MSQAPPVIFFFAYERYVFGEASYHYVRYKNHGSIKQPCSCEAKEEIPRNEHS